MNIGGFFGHIIGTTGLILSILIYPQHGAAVAPTPVVTKVTQGAINSSYLVSENYTYQGYAVTLALHIPKNGGAVNGTISGDCVGNITGTYDGQENGKINGQAEAACHVFLFSIPVTGKYFGVIHKEDKKMDVTVDVKADSFEKSESMNLSLQ